MFSSIKKDAESRMKSAIEFAKEEFAGIRTGRAHPAMFHKLMADYYGTPTPIQQLAGFQVPEARTILITPFDRNAMTAIEKAIRDSDLGVNPSNDGNAIRCILPQLSEERRKEYIKLARNKAEESRVALRNIRRHAIDEVSKLLKDKEIGEDDAHHAKDEMDALTKQYVEQIDELLKGKEAELLEV